ncbi:hypothetical protein, partial [Escherichia coli]|uniref:hypothetical protein n=1 Tax=Escherichia coli TaxID=562 RepID=UPI001BA47445
ASAGFCFWRGRKMNDCPRRYTQKKAAYRSVSPDLRKNPLRRVFLWVLFRGQILHGIFKKGRAKRGRSFSPWTTFLLTALP